MAQFKFLYVIPETWLVTGMWLMGSKWICHSLGSVSQAFATLGSLQFSGHLLTIQLKLYCLKCRQLNRAPAKRCWLGSYRFESGQQSPKSMHESSQRQFRFVQSGESLMRLTYKKDWKKKKLSTKYYSSREAIDVPRKNERSSLLDQIQHVSKKQIKINWVEQTDLISTAGVLWETRCVVGMDII